MKMKGKLKLAQLFIGERNPGHGSSLSALPLRAYLTSFLLPIQNSQVT